ncbi:MAG TPA: GNAT family protein [Solirubrobacterales bacterium]
MENLDVGLEGSIVTLEPLVAEHADELWQAAQDPVIWEWLAHIGSSREYFDRWFEMARAATEEKREGVFATRDRGSDEIVGSTSYMSVRPADHVVEIGSTWLNPSAWGSGANIEAQLLMLAHAFDTLGCLRVEFKTDSRNTRSRAALAAIPAQFEGVMRKYKITPDVGVRDSAYYSVIDEEWPQVRANLERRLAQSGSPSK